MYLFQPVASSMYAPSLTSLFTANCALYLLLILLAQVPQLNVLRGVKKTMRRPHLFAAIIGAGVGFWVMWCYSTLYDLAMGMLWMGIWMSLVLVIFFLLSLFRKAANALLKK